MIKFFVISLFGLMSISSTIAQSTTTIKEASDIENLEDTLGVLSYTLVNAADAEQRFLACRAFIPTLTKALKTPNSFDYPFERLNTISIQYPQDSSFRVFTWQLYVDSSEYRYYGAIQLNAADLQLIPLVDRSFQLEEVEYLQTDARAWYGALYYNIRQFDTPEGRKYLLFGYDGFEKIQRYEENANRGRAMAFSHSDMEQLSQRKLIDVLTLQDGKATFGAPVFSSSLSPQGKLQSRVVLEYSAESKIVCNYDEFEKAIIFDHLMATGGEIPDSKPMKIPDGTFEGYRLENGIWQYAPKMFNMVVDKPPREMPVLDQKSKDLFGRKKG